LMTRDEKLMPSDARGRVLVPKERREALLDEFERSGLSGVKFAQLAGIKYPTFASWVTKRREARRADAVELGGIAHRSGGFWIGLLRGWCLAGRDWRSSCREERGWRCSRRCNCRWLRSC
jgi:hypothetical protein